jgi:hypothetical protein
MEAKTITVLAIASWTLMAVCSGQGLGNTGMSPDPALQEIDTTAREKPGDLPNLLRAKLSAKPVVATAGTLVGRAFKDVSDRTTVLLARSMVFESDYADQEAVLEIVRQALLNSPSRLHPQIVAAAIVSILDPEEPVIIELAGAVSAQEEGEDVDEKAVKSVGGKFGVNLEVTDQVRNLPSLEGPLTYRLAANGEPGALALDDAILAVAISVDPGLDLAQFPVVLNGYGQTGFNPPGVVANGGFNPPGLAANGPDNLREPVDPRILDPRLAIKPVPSPTPVSP